MSPWNTGTREGEETEAMIAWTLDLADEIRGFMETWTREHQEALGVRVPEVAVTAAMEVAAQIARNAHEHYGAPSLKEHVALFRALWELGHP